MKLLSGFEIKAKKEKELEAFTQQTVAAQNAQIQVAQRLNKTRDEQDQQMIQAQQLMQETLNGLNEQKDAIRIEVEQLEARKTEALAPLTELQTHLDVRKSAIEQEEEAQSQERTRLATLTNDLNNRSAFLDTSFRNISEEKFKLEQERKAFEDLKAQHDLEYQAFNINKDIHERNMEHQQRQVDAKTAEWQGDKAAMMVIVNEMQAQRTKLESWEYSLRDREETLIRSAEELKAQNNG